MPLETPTNVSSFLSPLKGLSLAQLRNLITTQFGAMAALGGQRHWGIDLSATEGTPIYAPTDAKVKRTYSESAGGNVLIIESGSMEQVFAHLSRFAVSQNQTVSKGQIIGYTGRTGNVTGPHLHWEVKVGGKAINPLDLFDPTKTVDPSEYKGEYLCRPVIPFIGMNKDLWKPTKPDGTCDLGYILVDPSNTFIDLSGTPLEGVADAADAVPTVVAKVGVFLFNPANWAALLALIAGGVLVFVGGRMVWESV